MITEKEILDKYPKIFKDKDLPMTHTCMCWGLEVPDDWLPVIDQLCDAMQNYTYTSSGAGKFPQVVAEQVKYKWGGLRFYYRLEYPDPENVPEGAWSEHCHYIDGMIALAECIIDNMEKVRKNKEDRV